MHDEATAADSSARFAMMAAVLGFLAVALGAFGAHGLESALKDLPDGAKRLAWWETGSDYQLWHALLVGLIASLTGRFQAKLLRTSVWLSIVGVVLFSGSLYAMTLTGITKLGMVTPLGGLAFLASWATLGIAAWKSPRSS